MGRSKTARISSLLMATTANHRTQNLRPPIAANMPGSGSASTKKQIVGRRQNFYCCRESKTLGRVLPTRTASFAIYLCLINRHSDIPLLADKPIMAGARGPDRPVFADHTTSMPLFRRYSTIGAIAASHVPPRPTIVQLLLFNPTCILVFRVALDTFMRTPYQ